MNTKLKLRLFHSFYRHHVLSPKRKHWGYLFLLFGLTNLIQSPCRAQNVDSLEKHKQKINTWRSQVNQDPLIPPVPTPGKAAPENVLPPTQTVPPEDTQKPVEINKISVVGSTVFSPKDFQTIIKPLEDKKSSLAELKIIADRISQLYLRDGYITSRAIVVSDSLADGNIQIQIIEGTVEKIKVVGADRLTNYVRSRVNLGSDAPLNTGKLEEQLKLLRIDPLIKNIEAKIIAGSGIGQSTIVVRVESSPSLALEVGTDNYSPPSIGSERLNLKLAYQNLTGLGDRLSATYRPRIEAFGDTFDLDFQYRVPINAKNGTITAEVDLNRNKVVNGFAEAFEIEGEAERYSLSYRQPVIRSTSQELAFSLGFDRQDGQTFLLQEGFPFGEGADEDGVSRTSVVRFGQDYVKRQPSGAWAFRSSLNLGLGLFDATDNEDPIPDGQFFSWLGQVQRLQVLNDDNFLIIQSQFQFTPDSLLPSQQFVIGGGQSVRGYRQNARSGDNGLKFSIEDRLTLIQDKTGRPQFTLAPFFDMGTVWNNGDNPNQLPDQNFLAAFGLGAIWQPIEDLNLRIDYAPPLVDLGDRGDNIQDDGFHFSLSYSRKI